jgi:hypothetical protein
MSESTADTLRSQTAAPVSSVNETNHFFNLGYGWLCKHCSAEDAERHEERGGRWRIFQKSAAEKKSPRLPSLVLARWTDPTRQSLACPRCSIEELVDKA